MRRFLIPSLILIFIVFGAGCQFLESTPSSPGEGDLTEETSINLDSPTGGYSMSDEEPGFGEPGIFEGMAEEELYADPMEDDQEISNLQRNRHAKVFRLRSIWGHLVDAAIDSARTECCPIDWSGGLQMIGGYIVVEKTIRFDPQDYITRIDRSTVEWVSHTCPHVDGIQVKIVVPPKPDSIETFAAPMLIFKAGEFEKVITIDELAELRFHQPVDRCGNGIMISSHLRPFSCPTGYLLGEWRSSEPDTLIDEETGELRGILLGNYRGVWMGEHGMAAGFLRGVAGTNSEGEPVIFGKYIDLYGQFKGIIRGTWGYNGFTTVDTPEAGWFSGIWIGRDGGIKGDLKGQWLSDESGHGYFSGIWGVKCVDIDGDG